MVHDQCDDNVVTLYAMERFFHQQRLLINDEPVVDVVCCSLASVYIPLISTQFEADVHLSSALRCLDCDGPRSWSANALFGNGK
jgi:hypothetical protein